MKVWKKTGIVLLLITAVLFLCACGKTKEEKKKDNVKETELILPEDDVNEESLETQPEEPSKEQLKEQLKKQPETGNTDTTQNGTSSVTEPEQGEGKEENDITVDSQKDSGEITLPYVPFS